MANQIKGGTITFTIDGIRYDAKGNFTYNLGLPKREEIVGADGIHGFKEVQQPAFIEGEITDNATISLELLVGLVDATIILALANGKTISLPDAWWAGEGTGNSEEGNISVKFVGNRAREVT